MLLPLLGFFVGLIVGAQVVASIFGEGFLASVIGIVAGLVVGLLFGALAYVWWWLGVILVFAGMGYALGVSILPAFGLDLGFVSVLIGLAVAAVFAFGAIVLRMPKLIVDRRYRPLGQRRHDRRLADPHQPDRARSAGLRRRQRGRRSSRAFWLIVFFAVAVVGMAVQLATTQEYELMWDEEYPWESPATPTTPSAPSTL